MKAKDIDSLDDFKRRTKQVIAELKKTGRPRILTVNGKAAVVVQDATAYFEDQDLAQAQEERDMLANLRESIAQADRGQLIPAADVFKRLLARDAGAVRSAGPARSARPRQAKQVVR